MVKEIKNDPTSLKGIKDMLTRRVNDEIGNEIRNTRGFFGKLGARLYYLVTKPPQKSQIKKVLKIF